MVATTALLGPSTAQELASVLDRVPAVADLSRERRDAVRTWVLHLYPGTEPHTFTGLAPDRLAERLIGQLLLDTSRTCIVEVLAEGADELEAERLLTVTTRAAAHAALGSPAGDMLTELCMRYTTLLVPALRAALQTEQPDPLLRALDRTAAARNTGIATLLKVYDAIPERTQVLADTAASFAEALVDRRRRAFKDDPVPDGNDLAASLNNLSIRLGAVGHHEEGLAAIREAVDIRRQLAEQHQAAYGEALKKSLRVLTNLQGRGGDEAPPQSVRASLWLGHSGQAERRD